MKLNLLKNLANHFKLYKQIHHLKRIQDNLFKLEIDREIFYLDLQKHRSNIFLTPNLISNKSYYAPFDIALTRLATRAKILDCFCDGNNRILIFHCIQNHLYKTKEFFIHFEFTGKYTNAILVDANNIIIEALRHLTHHRSTREIKPNIPLVPLFQNNKDFVAICYDKTELYAILEENYQMAISQKFLQKKQQILQKLQKKLQKNQALLAQLPKPQTLETTAATLAKEATLLLANLHLIKPFQKQIDLFDFDGQKIQIQLQIQTTPQDYINTLFSQSKKCAKRAKNIHLEQENLRDRINFLNQKIAFIEKTQSFENLDILEPKKTAKKQIQKFECFFIEHFKISMGKNQAQNQALLESAKANDIWLHIKDIPSAHMIIHCGKTKPAQYVIQKAAEILVELNSTTKGDFRVDYTQRRFVKIKEKAKVVYTKHQTINYKK